MGLGQGPAHKGLFVLVCDTICVCLVTVSIEVNSRSDCKQNSAV